MDHIREIIREYQIEQEPITVLRETKYNSVYVVGTKSKKVLRVGYRISPDDVHFELEMLERLALSHVPVTKLNRTRKEENFVTQGDYVAVVFDYVDGYHPVLDKTNKPTIEECRVAGETLAKIHNATENYLPKSCRSRTLVSELERVVKSSTRFDEYVGGREFVKEIKEAISYAQSYKGTTALLHNDYRVDNLFFKNKNEVSAVIDFDWSCIGPTIKDIAHSVLVWSFPDGGIAPDEETIKHFMEGYNSKIRERIAYNETFKKWMQFGALADAATYFCDRLDEPGLEQRVNRSYMYKKFLYFLH